MDSRPHLLRTIDLYRHDQVLIRITHCGLCQYDGAYFKGIIGTPPLRLGHEPVGIVEAVGRNVQDVTVGERPRGHQEGGRRV